MWEEPSLTEPVPGEGNALWNLEKAAFPWGGSFQARACGLTSRSRSAFQSPFAPQSKCPWAETNCTTLCSGPGGQVGGEKGLWLCPPYSQCSRDPHQWDKPPLPLRVAGTQFIHEKARFQPAHVEETKFKGKAILKMSLYIKMLVIWKSNTSNVQFSFFCYFAWPIQYKVSIKYIHTT